MRVPIEIDIPDGQEIVEIEQQGCTIVKGSPIGHVFFTAIVKPCATEPELGGEVMSDDPLTTRIETHLRQMAPHVKQRMTASLLREALEEIRLLLAALGIEVVK